MNIKEAQEIVASLVIMDNLSWSTGHMLGGSLVSKYIVQNQLSAIRADLTLLTPLPKEAPQATKDRARQVRRNIKLVAKAHKNDIILDEWLPIHFDFIHPICTLCADRINGYEVLESNGSKIRISGECPRSGGFTEKFYLNVPSGKIVCADILGCNKLPTRHDVGTIAGSCANSRWHESYGRIFIPIHDNPDVYKMGDGYLVASKQFILDELLNHLPMVGEIGGGAWSVNFMDYDQWVLLSDFYGDDYHKCILDVEPGEYEFVFDFTTIITRKNHVIKFKRIGPPKDVINYVEEFTSFNPSARACFEAAQQSVYAHVSTFSELNALSFILSSGVPDRDWNNRYGFSLFFTPRETPAVESDYVDRLAKPGLSIPVFRNYDIEAIARGSKYGTPIHLNSSHANAALKLIECYYKGDPYNIYGDRYTDQELIAHRDRLADQYKQILERYPDSDFDLQDFTETICSLHPSKKAPEVKNGN